MDILAAAFKNPYAAFWSLLAIYLVIGLIIAIPFAFLAAGKILDEPADMTVGARILIIPGAAVVWPVVLTRWLRVGSADAVGREPSGGGT